LPLSTFENHWENAGAHAFSFTYKVEYDMPEGILGKVLDTGLMIGPYLKRDMRLQLEKLGEVFMAMHEGKVEQIA
jgi:hypothetical protein